MKKFIDIFSSIVLLTAGPGDQGYFLFYIVKIDLI